MKATRMFQNTLAFATRQWLAKCVLVALVICLGWITGTLQIVCCSLIFIFGWTQGASIFLKFNKKFARTQSLAREEIAEMRSTDQMSLEEWDAALETISLQGAGPVLKMFAAIRRNKHRAKKRDVVDAFVAAEEQRWHARLAPVSDAGEICCLLGLTGSLLGILQAVTGGGGVAAIENSMGVMASTSAVGAGLTIVLLGLTTLGNYAIARYVSELRLAANIMPGDDDDEPQDDFVSLF